MSDRPEETAAEVKPPAQAKIADIESRIRDLERMKSALSELEAHRPGHAGTTADCPILSALNQSKPESAEEVHP